MTKTFKSNMFRLDGNSSVFSQIFRAMFLIVTALGGLIMLAFLASFAFFVVIGLILIGSVIFGFMWARAKLFGKPFGPRAQFEAARKDMEAQFQSSQNENIGPVIDAHRTPDGWSVDE